MVPAEVEGADDPGFVLMVEGGAVLELGRAPFKVVYARFRALTKVPHHYEAKWEKALDVSLKDEWSQIW